MEADSLSHCAQNAVGAISFAAEFQGAPSPTYPQQTRRKVVPIIDETFDEPGRRTVAREKAPVLEICVPAPFASRKGIRFLSARGTPDHP